MRKQRRDERVAGGYRESRVATLKGSGDGPNLSPEESWWPGEQARVMDEVARPNSLATPDLAGGLWVGVSDWTCRVSTDYGSEKAVKGPVELLVGIHDVTELGSDLVQAERWASD